MQNLLSYEHVSYDSMIIIYYCLNNKDYYLIEFCDKAQKMTSFLIQNDMKITVPSFLISEIKRKDAIKMIDQYIASRQIANYLKTLIIHSN